MGERAYMSGGGEAHEGRAALPPMTPAVKWLLIAVLAIFTAEYFLDLAFPAAGAVVREWLGLDHSKWFRSPVFAPLWQLGTYSFLHVGIGHVLFNMLGLFFFGTMLETIVGTRRFVQTYAAAVVLGGLASVLLMRLTGEAPITFGCSAGVAGAIVASAVFRPMATVVLIFIPIPLWVLAAGFVAIDLFSGIDLLVKGVPTGVDSFAHLAGALYGFLAVKLGFIWNDWAVSLQRLKAAREVAQSANDEDELDRLLARVGKEGIHALDRRERAFLKRMSARKSKGPY